MRVILKNKHLILVFGLVIVGFIFRLKGISSNHSFWSDEAYSSEISRKFVMGEMTLVAGLSSLWYQGLQFLTVAASFFCFGPSEWSARLPSVIWGSGGILAAYLLGRKLSNLSGGLLSAFLYTFLQINLTYSTQARPYAALQTLLILELYLVTLLETKPNKRILISAIMVASASTLYHYLGIFSWIPLLVYFIPKLKLSQLRSNIFVVIPAIVFVLMVLVLGIYRYLPAFFDFKYNWLTYSRDLFWRQFSFLTLPALFGLFLIKSRIIRAGIFSYLAIVFYSWNFIAYSHNIRYLIPVFGLIIVLFSVFWANVGEILFKKSFLVCICVAFLLFVGGYKIVRKPAVYYTPNADFFADVQNSDAKSFFQEVYDKFPDFDSHPLFIGPFDTLSWYSTRKPTALFSIYTVTPVYDQYNQAWSYGTLADFLVQQKKFERGFVIVHDWQSFIPDEIKEYIKKNMKLEIRVESMAVSPDEKWPLELYSWGFDAPNE